MTKQEFDGLIDEAEKTLGRAFSKEWRDSRFETVKTITVKSFRENMLPALLAGTPIASLDME